jgi:methylmalonyl-CoA mutase N-terminal domain/subunit
LSLPTEESAQLALRTQQIIAHESGVTKTVDPVGGSLHVERLTDDLERQAVAYLDRIDAMGGTLRAIERGYIQGEIQRAAYEYQKAVESGRQVVVGVNRFVMEEKQSIPIFRFDPMLEKAQVDRLRELRASRAPGVVGRERASLEQAARGVENLMPHILGAAEAYATVGEISDRLRAVFGEYKDAA